MSTNLKRQLDPSIFEEDNYAEKKLCVDLSMYEEFGIYRSQLTPLLVPDLNLAPLKTPRLFIRKVFRLIDCNLVVNFPEMTSEEIRQLIPELEEKYKGNYKEGGEELS